MPLDPPSLPCPQLSKPSSPASPCMPRLPPTITMVSLGLLCFGDPWGPLNWSQHPAVASPSLPLSYLAQPRAHSPVSPGPQRGQGSSSCIQRLFCMPNFLPLLSHKLLMSKIPDLSRLPWTHQTLSEGTIPGVKHLRFREPTWAQCIMFLTDVPSG